MITLTQSNLNKNRITGLLAGVVGIIIIIATIGEFSATGIGFSNADEMFDSLVAIFQVICGLIVTGIGFITHFTAKKTGPKFESYFEQKRVTTIAEIATELNITNEAVIKSLSLFASRPDIKKLRKCENVQFSK